MNTWDTPTRPRPVVTRPESTSPGEKLVGAVALLVVFAFIDAALFMWLIRALHTVWFPRLPVLGYWQAFGIIVPVQWLARRVKVAGK